MNTSADAIVADSLQPSICRRMANAIRFLSIDAIVRATEGHQGVPLGMAEIATALYTPAPEVRSGRSDLAGPRPRRAVQWPRLDAAVLAAVPDGL